MTGPKNHPPRRAIAGAVSACLSLSGFLWVLWPGREPKIEIGSYFGPSPQVLIANLSLLLTGVALICCAWSWRTESRAWAAVVTVVVLPALVISSWLLMRLYL